MIFKHDFYKDEQGWFIDYPEFLEAGYGTKANLQMVAGADFMLEDLSKGKDRVTLKFSHEWFENSHRLEADSEGMDAELLKYYDHPIEIGMYYINESGQSIWLCPVAAFIFGGMYPSTIYYQKIA